MKMGSMKKMFGSKKSNVIDPSAPAAAKENTPADQKEYSLEVPPLAKPGSKMKLTIPGMEEKVIVTVPDGAAPGDTIQFCPAKPNMATVPKTPSTTEITASKENTAPVAAPAPTPAVAMPMVDEAEAATAAAEVVTSAIKAAEETVVAEETASAAVEAAIEPAPAPTPAAEVVTKAAVATTVATETAKAFSPVKIVLLLFLLFSLGCVLFGGYQLVAAQAAYEEPVVVAPAPKGLPALVKGLVGKIIKKKAA